MLKQLYKDLKLNISTPIVLLVLVLMAFGAGFSIAIPIMVFAETTTDWFCMGALFALVSLVLVGVFSSISYHSEFMLALSMGRTRKEFMFSFALRQLISIGVGYLLVLALYHVELAAWAALFPTKPCEVYFTFFTEWWMFLLIPILALFSMFVGALYSRFSSRWLNALCCIGALASIGSTNLLLDEHTESSLFASVAAIFGAISPAAWLALGCGAVIAMVVTILHLGRKQMVH